MKRIKIFFISSIISITFFNNSFALVPFYSIRSQGVDAARELAGWTQHVNLADKDEIYGSFSATPEYTKSFNSNQIAHSLLGTSTNNNSCSTTTINISGSAVANRGVNDWLADYFYLPPDFQSTIHFKPTIKNALVDLNAYIGFDRWVHGLFFRIHSPLTWSRWDLNFCETNIIAGTANYDEGYFAPKTVYRDALLPNFTAFAQGIAVTDLQSTDSTIPTFNGLHFAQITPCPQSLIRLADIQMVFGWNFLLCDDYHLGAGLRVVAPTGSRVQGVYLFEPVVGNGKHWEVGTQITGHVSLWENEEEDQAFGLYVDTNITHLFRTRQTRTFDLKNKPFSRYMLAESLGSPITNGLVGGTPPVIPNYQFLTTFKNSTGFPINGFTPVANITTQDVLVSAAVQVDLAAQLTYTNNGFAFDLGYNLWARSCEKIKSIWPTAGCQFVELQTNWAIKGDAHVYGFASAADAVSPTLTLLQPVALSATNSSATINAGTNAPATNNPNIDGAQLAFAGGTPTALQTSTTNTTQINTSIQPIFITGNDLDIISSRGLSNKIYSHFSYSWFDNPHLVPYLGVGLFAEWGQNGNDNSSCSNVCSTSSGICDNNCITSCNTATLSQWGVWMKGGLSF